VTFLALSVHLLAAAVWLGAMAYSLAVVQPRSQGFIEDERRREAFATVLAAGARRPVLGVIALLAASGAALVALEAGDDPGSGWWLIVGAKVALLAAAAALFWHVSWRLWPQRLFATPEELPALRGRFRGVAWALLALLGLEFVLGAAATLA
jgi:hypothetical protein